MFSCEFHEISKNTFFTEHLWSSSSENKCSVLTAVQTSFWCTSISIFSKLDIFSCRCYCSEILADNFKKIEHFIKSKHILTFQDCFRDVWTRRTLQKKWSFPFKNFFSKCDQIRRKLRFWSHLLKKSLMEKSIFWAVADILI